MLESCSSVDAETSSWYLRMLSVEAAFFAACYVVYPVSKLIHFAYTLLSV